QTPSRVGSGSERAGGPWTGVISEGLARRVPVRPKKSVAIATHPALILGRLVRPGGLHGPARPDRLRHVVAHAVRQVRVPLSVLRHEGAGHIEAVGGGVRP